MARRAVPTTQRATPAKEAVARKETPREEKFEGAASADAGPNADGLGDAGGNIRDAPDRIKDLGKSGFEDQLGSKIPDSDDGGKFADQLTRSNPFERGTISRADVIGGGLGDGNAMSGGSGGPGGLDTRQGGIDALVALGHDGAQLKGMSDSQIRDQLQREANAMHTEGTTLEGKEGADLEQAAQNLADRQNAGQDTAGDDGSQGATPSTGEASPGANSPEAAVADTVADQQKIGTDEETSGTGVGTMAGEDGRGAEEAKEHWDAFEAGHEGIQFAKQTGGLSATVEPVNYRDLHRGGDPAEGGAHVRPDDFDIVLGDAPPGSSTDGTTQPVDGDGTLVTGPSDNPFTTGDDWLSGTGRPPGEGDDDPVGLGVGDTGFAADTGMVADTSFSVGSVDIGNAGDVGGGNDFATVGAESDDGTPDAGGDDPGGLDF
jgi:hypothetical protein